MFDEATTTLQFLIRETLPDISDDALSQLMSKVITKSLPTAAPSRIQSLLELILSTSSTSSQKVIAALFHEDCKPADILFALIQCRNAVLDRCMPHIHQMNTREQKEEIDNICVCFDRVQAQLLNTVESSWRSRVGRMQVKLHLESEAHMLSRATKSWIKTGHVEMYNHFREIPITATVLIKSVLDHGVIVELSPELSLVIAASEGQTSAYIRLPEEGYRLHVRVSGKTGKNLHWSFDGIQELSIENRSNMLARCVPPTPISIKHERKSDITAHMLDFSSNGLTIMTKKSQVLKNGDSIVFYTQFPSGPCRGGGIICWLHDEGEFNHMGIEFDHQHHATAERLRKETQLRIKQTVSFLKCQSRPLCLQSDWKEAN